MDIAFQTEVVLIGAKLVQGNILAVFRIRVQGGKNGSNVILKEHILPPSFVINFGGINHANGVVTVAENNERRSDIGIREHLDRQRDDTLDHLAFHKISAHRGINTVPCAAIGHNANRFAALCKKVAEQRIENPVRRGCLRQPRILFCKTFHIIGTFAQITQSHAKGIVGKHFVESGCVLIVCEPKYIAKPYLNI